VADSGAGKPLCDEVEWRTDAYAIRHVIGLGGVCGRCGDPTLMLKDEPVGREYIYRDSNDYSPTGTNHFAVFESTAEQAHLEQTPRCHARSSA
jgi:hypothetical protein